MNIHASRNYHPDYFKGISLKKTYLQYPKTSKATIYAASWNDDVSVKKHRHAYYEIGVVMKGTFLHEYKGVEVPLIPGDVFIIEPGKEHSCYLQSSVNVLKCNFFLENLDTKTKVYCENMLEKILENDNQDFMEESYGIQNIIRLEDKELKEVETIYQLLINEQNSRCVTLRNLIDTLYRIQEKRRQRIDQCSEQKKVLVQEAIDYMEQHFEEKVDFEEVSRNLFLSLSYFRSVFKSVTGFRPTEYLNRMRIVKSLEYLEDDQCSVADAAAWVGIYDSNYYSRVFKKIIGYSPKYYKAL